MTNLEAAPAAVTDPRPAPPAPAQAATDAEVTRLFSRSVVISGLRCTLAYVVFPWLLPLVGLAGATGPVVGLVIGVIAVGFNIASIRRFQATGHRWRWPITALNCTVIVLLAVLAVEDIAALL